MLFNIVNRVVALKYIIMILSKVNHNIIFANNNFFFWKRSTTYIISHIIRFLSLDSETQCIYFIRITIIISIAESGLETTATAVELRFSESFFFFSWTWFTLRGEIVGQLLLFVKSTAIAWTFDDLGSR